MIDSTMSKVVEKINLKRDLEKRNRDLKMKHQKRLDEVNSLYLLENKISQDLIKQQEINNKMSAECQFLK
jgi:hypothetical protein